MDILSASFGVFFWTFITVFFVLVILKHFAYKLMINCLEKRKEIIDSSISNSLQIEKRLESLSEHERNFEIEMSKRKKEMLDKLEIYKKELLEKIRIDENNERIAMHKRLEIEEKEKKLAFEEQCYNRASVMALSLVKKMLIRGTDTSEKQNLFIKELAEEFSVSRK